MAVDMFSTDVMMRVVASLFPAPQFILDRYFGTVQTETGEEIHFDVFDDFRRVAPFVNPLVEGQIVESLGYSTKTFKPAYIKDKRVFDMARPFKRSAGEAIGGSLSPMDRLRALLAQDTQDQLNMLNRRLEIMAAETLQTGKLVIEGEKYARVQLDFNRSATLTVPAAKLWTDPTSLPLNDIEKVNAAMLPLSGSFGTDVIMGVEAWQAFRENSQVVDRISLFRRLGEDPSLQMNGINSEGAVSMGTIDSYRIFVYAGWYVDPMTGATKPIWDKTKVAVASPAIEGVRCYGAIKDEEAGLQAVPYYSKSWIQPDPSVRYLMLQSAPLTVPTRINASGIVSAVVA